MVIGRWKVAYQVALPIIVMLFLIALLGYQSWSSNKQLSHLTHALTDNLTPASVTVLNADRDLYQSLVGLGEVINKSSRGENYSAFKGSYVENYQQAKTRMLESRQLAETNGVVEVAGNNNAFLSAFKEWQATADKVIALAEKGEVEQAISLYDGQQMAQFEALREFYDVFGEQLSELRKQVGHKTVDIEEAQLQMTVVLFSIAVIFGLLALSTMPKMLANRVKRLQSTMEELSQSGGDLTYRLPVDGNNELAQLAKSTNSFLEYLHKMLQEIERNVENVVVGNEHISGVSRATGSSTQLQTDELNTLANSMAELTAAIAEVAQQSQLSAEEANATRGVVTESSKDIKVTIDQISQLVVAMESTSTIVSTLEQRSQNINSVLQVIGGIAEQTNLLALNAAIEAARAGESGRGFAVVADEVRALAQKTQESTQTIQSTLNELNSEVIRAVESVQEGQVQAANTSQSAEAAIGAMEEIIAKVNAIADFSIQIAAATEEQSAVVAQMNDNTDKMKSNADSVLNNVHETADAVGEISSQVSQLSQKVKSFKL